MDANRLSNFNSVQGVGFIHDNQTDRELADPSFGTEIFLKCLTLHSVFVLFNIVFTDFLRHLQNLGI